MSAARQMNLFKKTSVEHGGEKARGRRKTMRPLDPKRPIHLVLRSSRARGALSLLHPSHVRHVGSTARKVASDNDVQLMQYANVGNHLHLVIRVHSKKAFQRFLRMLTGRVAQIVTGAFKGNAFGRFWDHLAYTRVVAWGRDLRATLDYVVKNVFEGAGLLTPAEKRGWRVVRIPRDRPG